MIFISGATIDRCLDIFEEEEIYKESLASLILNQADLMALISKENQNLLTETECGLLEYLTVVIYSSAKNQTGNIPFIKGNELEEAEEKNWEIFNTMSSQPFIKILDRFFDGYEQEDLLALVEDSIQNDDDYNITAVGREIILVVCKSIIDTLDQRL